MEHPKKPLPALQRSEKYIGLAYLIFQMMLLPLLIGLVLGAFSSEINSTLANFLYFFVNFICTIAIFSKLLKKSFLRAAANWEGLFITTIIGFAVYRACETALGILVFVLFPDFSNLNDGALVEILGEYPLIMLLSTVILAPVAEELLHRGLIFGWLQEKNEYMAYGLSAFLFSAIHVVQYIGLYSAAHIFVALMLYLPAGLVFAWTYRRSGTILSPILIHTANNLLAFLFVR